MPPGGAALTRRLVMGLVGDDPADTALGGGVVAGAAGDQMQVAVEDGLAGSFAVAGAKGEAGNGRLGGLEIRGEFLGKAMGGGPFFGGEVAEGDDMPDGDNQGVTRTDGETIAEGKAGTLAGDDPFGRQFAERTGWLHRGRIKPFLEGGKC